MRILLLATLLMTACSREASPPPDPGIAPGQFAASGRDGLCIVGTGEVRRAGFITYGDGDANCAVSGRIAKVGAQWALAPAGDLECRIPLEVTKDGITLGAVAPSCAYYCAPGVSFARKSFKRTEQQGRGATDFGGDPLC
jgi:hypothetical protein